MVPQQNQPIALLNFSSLLFERKHKKPQITQSHRERKNWGGGEEKTATLKTVRHFYSIHLNYFHIAI